MKRTTKTQKIYDRLRHRIVSGSYDGQLPSVRDLAQEFKVHYSTVYRAVMQLAEDGYLVGKPGSGLYVPPERRIRSIDILLTREQDPPKSDFYLEVVCHLAEALLHQGKDLRVSSVTLTYDPVIDLEAIQQVVKSLKGDLVFGLRLPPAVDLAAMTEKPVIQYSAQLRLRNGYFLTSVFGATLLAILSELRQGSIRETGLILPMFQAHAKPYSERYRQLVEHVCRRFPENHVTIVDPGSIPAAWTRALPEAMIVYKTAPAHQWLGAQEAAGRLTRCVLHCVDPPDHPDVLSRSTAVWSLDPEDVVEGVLAMMDDLVRHRAAPHTHLLFNRRHPAIQA